MEQDEDGFQYDSLEDENFGKKNVSIDFMSSDSS